jgi:DNA-binding CsgD family transcriptional regulator
MHESNISEFPLLERTYNLSEYLRQGSISWDPLMNFLLVDTFFGSTAFGHILHTVGNDGSLLMPAKVGFSVWPTEKFPDRFITAETQLNRSLRTGQIVDCGSFDSFTFAGPDYLSDLFPNGFRASIAWPIPGIGSILTFYDEATELTEGQVLFLKLIGSLIASSFKNSEILKQLAPESKSEHLISPVALTSRQWNILRSMRRGKTNPEIAEDLGFSESLVRHETMKIYRSLSIEGRKELIEMPDQVFPFLEQ